VRQIDNRRVAAEGGRADGLSCNECGVSLVFVVEPVAV
jgi:hypothetical protein